MDYTVVENLVTLAKLGDNNAKENLVIAFNPLILNISKKSFVNSYEFSDIRNECYKTLFKCVSLYNSDKHCFVGYATNAIKNSVNNLIKVSVRRESSEGKSAFILDGNLENTLYSDVIEDVDNLILSKLYITNLQSAIEALTPIEQELITYIFFEKYSLRKYSELKGIPYATLLYRKKIILMKLKMSLNIPQSDAYIN